MVRWVPTADFSPQVSNLGVLVIGAGKVPYRVLMPASSSICCTDIEPGAGIDLVADAHALPFPDRSFNSVIAIEVFEHLYDPKLAASEIHRVLRSGGEAVVTVPFMFRIHGDPQDYQRFTSSGLEALFGGRFQTGIQPFGNRLQVISDLLPTSAKFMAVLRSLTISCAFAHLRGRHLIARVGTSRC